MKGKRLYFVRTMAAKKTSIALTVDAVVFGYSKTDGVQVLAVRRKYPPFKDEWALPGGFVQEDESLEAAVQRELQEESGITVNYLEQLYTFGEPGRDPRQRIVSVAYFALVKSSRYQQLKASTDAADVRWFNFKQLPKLAFDHKAIINTAIARVRAKVRYQPIGFELLDKTFPFSDLEQLYATLLDRPIDRRNFAKKMAALNILDEAPGAAKPEGKGRPGKLYSFNKKRYSQLQKEGIHFEI